MSAVLMLGATTDQEANAAPPLRRTTALTPSRYRTALETVRSCDDFFNRAAALPDATLLLRTLFEGGLPEKAGAETDDAFLDRVIRSLYQRVGDPSRLVTGVRIDPAAMKPYDAGSRAITVVLKQPFEATLDQWQSRDPAGGPRNVELRAGYGFPARALPPEIALPMSAEEAARFRAGNGRLVILSLFQDYGTDEATPAAPGGTASKTAYHLVRLTPKCAVFTAGGVAVPGWRFDGWTAARNAE